LGIRKKPLAWVASGAGEWLFEKHRTSKRRSWRKPHIGIAADSDEIVAFDPTDKEVPDASHVGPLLEQVADAPASLMSDGAYDRAHVLDAVLAKNPAVGFIVSLVHLSDQRTWAHELAENIRLPSSLESRSGDRPLQARDWDAFRSGEV
jgi:DDE family transposase